MLLWCAGFLFLAFSVPLTATDLLLPLPNAGGDLAPGGSGSARPILSRVVPCPEDFEEYCCGPLTPCSCTQSTALEELITTNMGYYHEETECEYGDNGAIAAVYAGAVYEVSSWGICAADNPDGMHMGGADGMLFINAGMSELETIRTAWHEGWSRDQGCEDYECHDELFLRDMEEWCYPAHYQAPMP